MSLPKPSRRKETRPPHQSWGTLVQSLDGPDLHTAVAPGGLCDLTSPNSTSSFLNTPKKSSFILLFLQWRRPWGPLCGGGQHQELGVRPGLQRRPHTHLGARLPGDAPWASFTSWALDKRKRRQVGPNPARAMPSSPLPPGRRPTTRAQSGGRPGLPSGLAALAVPASQGCPAIREGCQSVRQHACHCVGDAETTGSQARRARPLILALKGDVSGWQDAPLGQCTQPHASARGPSETQLPLPPEGCSPRFSGFVPSKHPLPAPSLPHPTFPLHLSQHWRWGGIITTRGESQPLSYIIYFRYS